jgi:flagellar biosynthesis/type III secretory pathway protein FliH
MLAERVIEWTEQWKQQGLQEGIERGIEQGIHRGRKEGEAALLLRFLERRFGPVDEMLRQRLQAADAETLLNWGERLFHAASAEEVLRN